MKKYSAMLTQGLVSFWRIRGIEVEANNLEEAEELIIENYKENLYNDGIEIEHEDALSENMINGWRYRQCLEYVLNIAKKENNQEIIEYIQDCFDTIIEDDIVIHDLKEI